MEITRIDNGVYEVREVIASCEEWESVVLAYFGKAEHMDIPGFGSECGSECGSYVGWIPATGEVFQSCAKNVYNAVRFNLRWYAHNPEVMKPYRCLMGA